MSRLRILLLGDVVGAPGRVMLQKHLPRLRTEHSIDGVIVNGENSAHGKGITPSDMKFFKHIGVDVVTTGNHIWQRREIISYFADHKDLLRPANFPSDTPGSGVTTFMCKGYEVAVVNIQGRVFMRELLADPFRTAESLLTYLRSKTKIIFVDFHAETTSEKTGMGYFLDGRVSGVVGTHTHVQTADERILPNGTAFISDLGMTGPYNSVIGKKLDSVLEMFLTQMPVRFEVADGPYQFNAVVLDIDEDSGKAESIDRILNLE